MRNLILLVSALIALLPAAAFAQGALKSVHGDWQLRCDKPPGAQQEQCVIIQFVTDEDRQDIGLIVTVYKTADNESRILSVIAPLGVFIPLGLGLKIDDTDIGAVNFVRCLPNGCKAEVIMDDPLIERFRNGQTAWFRVFQTPEEGIGIPISLDGFADGFQALP